MSNSGTCAYLYSSMAAEVKVKLVRMCDVRVDSRSSRNVSAAAHLQAAYPGIISQILTTENSY